MSSKADIILEVCVDSVGGLAAAIAGGADRIELCAALALGGLTPSPGLISLAREASVPIYAMVRPREGGFHYAPAELDQMARDVDAVRELGLAGVVFGCLDKDNFIDEAAMRRLIECAGPLGVTIHRAFDLAPDPIAALDTVISLGVERVLTSGGQTRAELGLERLATLVRHAAGRISIMPGSGVSVANAATIRAATGATELHASCAVALLPENEATKRMGFASANPRTETNETTVIALKAALAA